jgi:hypothetical protein
MHIGRMMGGAGGERGQGQDQDEPRRQQRHVFGFPGLGGFVPNSLRQRRLIRLGAGALQFPIRPTRFRAFA